MIQPLSSHPDLVNQVYLSLRDAICEGNLIPGERLNQDQLASQLQVSRQPVSQAIQLLKIQGFVRDTGRRGVEIAVLSSEEITGFYQIRAALDALAAREAAIKNPDLALRKGHALIEEGRRLCLSGSIMKMIHADMSFHRFIYKISGNPVIDTTVSPHWYHLIRIMGQVLQPTASRQQIWDEHEAIIYAISEGDAEKAQLLARRHSEQAAADLANK